MKLFKNIVLLAATALLAACETKIDTPQIYSPEDFVAPVINDCSDIVVTEENSDTENVEFSWSAADFGQPVQILYSLYLVYGDQEGLVGTSNTTSLSISKGDINGVVINSLGVTANETAEGVTAYVTAQIANTTKYDAIQSNTSNEFSVQTYAADLKLLYLCGEFNGWSETSAPEFYETNSGTNTYTCMVDFSVSSDNTNSFFKVLPERSWSTSYGKDDFTASWTIADNTDGNLSMPITEATIHEVTVNMAAMTIDQTAIGNTLGLCGTFNNWGEDGDDAAFTYDALSGTWKTDVVALESGGEVKVRADAAWTTNWGASGKSSTAVAGGLELEAGSNDNLTVSESGNFIVVLHANRTPYVLEFIEQ